MDFLKKAAGKALEKVGLSTGNYDEQLEQYKNRLEHLENTITQFKKGFDTYAKAMQAQGNALSSLSQDLSSFYTRPEDKRSITSFHDSTQTLTENAQRIFKDTYGWDILQSFDEWEAETKKIHAEIKKVESARLHLEAAEKSVTAMRTAKAAGRSMTKQDEEKLQAGEEKLEKYQKAYTKMRTALDGQVTAHVDARYSTLDHMFYRLMEFQLEYYRTAVQSVDPLQSLVDTYRKKSPPFQTKQTPTGSASARIPSPNHASAPSKAYPATARVPTSNGKKPAKPAQPESEEDVFEEDEESEEEESDEEPAPKPVKKQSSKPSPVPVPPSQTSPSLDIFGFDSPPPSAPIKKSSSATQPSPSSSGDLFDLFSSPAAAAPTAAKPPTKPATPSTSTPDLDNLFGEFANSSKTPAPKSQGKQSNLGKSASHDGGLGVFDPFASAKSSTTQVRATTPQPSRPTATASQPSPRAPTQPNSARMATATEKPSFEVGSAELEKQIKDAQEEKLREIREREKKAEAEAKAKEQALGGLEDKLKQWEFKDGQQKNIRNLLQGVHNVLWPELGWKAPSLTDLMDFNGIKKFHRKAVILLHPDKLVHCTPEQKVIGERVFDVLQSAFDKFKDAQAAGGQGF